MRWLNDEQIPAFPFLLFIVVLRGFIPPPPREGLCRISRCFNPCFPFCSGGFLTIQMLGGGVGAGSHCAPREPCAAGRWDR